MASIISELRSVTFQSKSTTVFLSEINIRKDNTMAPQQHDILPKTSDFEVEQSQKSSPVSNLGTSVESSPPVLPTEDGSGSIILSKEEPKIEETLSDDSGSAQDYEVNQEVFQSPLMCLQSALKKDGMLGKKLRLSSSSPKSTVENNWSTSTSNGIIFEKLPTASTGFFDGNLPSATTDRKSPTKSNEMQHNLPSTATTVYSSKLPSAAIRMYDTSLQSSTVVHESSLPLSSSGLYNGNLQSVTTRFNQGTLHSSSKGIFYNSPSTSNTTTFSCRVCDFTCTLEKEYLSHMNLHYKQKCPYCNYTSKTEGRLKRHVSEFHSDTPPESWAGSRAKKETGSDHSIDNSVSSNGKARAYKCKHCDFVAYEKNEYWNHCRMHIKPEKLLECPQCEFVTEFKHHYEYHQANHAGCKPFRCPRCNYKCVNKSMLNSHMKSHSSVYQYHCADCNYETKYCHSIKQHLKKQKHKQGVVLDQDGIPTDDNIDVYGRRRGPRSKKRKHDITGNISPVSPANHQPTVLPNNPQSMTYPTSVPMLHSNIPTLYPSFYGEYSQGLMLGNNSQMNTSSFSMPLTLQERNHEGYFHCSYCPFAINNENIFKRHLLVHLASENQDIAKLYGINSDFFCEQEMELNSEASKQNNTSEPEECDKKLFSPTAENDYKSPEILQDYMKKQDKIVPETHRIKNEDGSSPKYRKISSPKNDDETASFREFSSPSPLGSSSYSSDVGAHSKKDFSDPRTPPNLSEKKNHVDDNELPIDLSGRRSIDSTKTDKTIDDIEEIQIMEQKVSPSTSFMESSNVSSTIQRNRRKGKAYKINHYMQYDEQSAFPKEKSNCGDIDSYESSVENLQELFKGHSKNSVKESSIFPNKRQNTNSPTSHAEGNHFSNHQQESKVHLNPCTNTDSQIISDGIRGHSPTPTTDRIAERIKDSSSLAEHTVLKSNVKSQSVDIKQSQLGNLSKSDFLECPHCQMLFKDCAMYFVHKGYHGFNDPFTCNSCGCVTKSALEFFIHIARDSHA